MRVEVRRRLQSTPSSRATFSATRPSRCVLMDAVQLRDSLRLRADWERLVGAARVSKRACYLATLQKQS